MFMIKRLLLGVKLGGLLVASQCSAVFASACDFSFPVTSGYTETLCYRL